MNISSKITYVLPCLLLLVPTGFLTAGFAVKYLQLYNQPTFPQILISILLTIFIYLGIRKLMTRIKPGYIKWGLLFFPLILDLILSLILSVILHRHFYFGILPLLFGAFYYFAFVLFNKRYTATLTDTAIRYQTLLGQSGEIPLHNILILEQKKNVLSVFRELRFLNLSVKTGITFCDEDRSEYEIDIFTRVFHGKEIFDSIIANANACGNLKIRQYCF